MRLKLFLTSFKIRLAAYMHTDGRKEFHASGPVYDNALSPNFVR
jgi:hypothetical protein